MRLGSRERGPARRRLRRLLVAQRAGMSLGVGSKVLRPNSLNLRIGICLGQP
jgi:hypothetical protein